MRDLPEVGLGNRRISLIPEEKTRSERERSDEPGSSPEQSATRADIRRLLEQKIDELPVAFRTVFVLREVEDLSVDETASCLSIPEATVRSRMFRARGMLRESLAPASAHGNDSSDK